MDFCEDNMSKYLRKSIKSILNSRDLLSHKDFADIIVKCKDITLGVWAFITDDDGSKRVEIDVIECLLGDLASKL